MVFTGGDYAKKHTTWNDGSVTRVWQKKQHANYVTVETNGTKLLQKNLKSLLIIYTFGNDREWYWSLSPKLWSTAGEKSKKAIQIEVIGRYARSYHGQLNM